MKLGNYMPIISYWHNFPYKQFVIGILVGIMLVSFLQCNKDTTSKHSIDLSDVIQHDKVTIIDKPDGTKIKIVDHSIETIKYVTKTVLTGSDKKWLITAAMGSRINDPLKPTYMLGLSKKIISNAFFGVYIKSPGEFGITLTYNF